MDDKLEWRSHYNSLVRRAKMLCGWVFNTFSTRDRLPLLTLYYSLIRSKLEFACQIWSPYLTKDIALIEKVQRSFISRIRGCKDLNYWERLKELNVMSLQRRRERCILLHVFKIKAGVYPNTIDMRFKTVSRPLAVKAILKPLPKVSGKLLSVYEERFSINSAKLWNILPSKISLTDKYSLFESELDKFLKTVPDLPPIPGYPYTNNNSLTKQCFEY